MTIYPTRAGPKNYEHEDFEDHYCSAVHDIGSGLHTNNTEHSAD